MDKIAFIDGEQLSYAECARVMRLTDEICALLNCKPDEIEGRIKALLTFVEEVKKELE